MIVRSFSFFVCIICILSSVINTYPENCNDYPECDSPVIYYKNDRYYEPIYKADIQLIDTFKNMAMNKGLIISEKKYTVDFELRNFILLKLRKKISDFLGTFKGNQFDHAVRAYCLENFKFAQIFYDQQISPELKKLYNLAVEINAMSNQYIFNNNTSYIALKLVRTSSKIFQYLWRTYYYVPSLNVDAFFTYELQEMQITQKFITCEIETEENLIEGLYYLTDYILDLIDLHEEKKICDDNSNNLQMTKIFYDAAKKNIDDIKLFTDIQQIRKDKIVDDRLIQIIEQLYLIIDGQLDYLMEQLIDKQNQAINENSILENKSA